MALTIRNRTLIHRGTRTGYGVETLQAVGDLLKKIEVAQDPQDLRVALNDVRVDFSGQQMAASVGTEDYRFSTNGAGQLARTVLPPRFFAGLKQLASRSDQGSLLATQVWEEFVHNLDNVRMLRTVNMNLPGGVAKVVRSSHSTKYAPYSNLFFVKSMLNYASSNFTTLPVVDWLLADDGFRLRFVDGDIHAGEALPMIEVWNSETGNRQVGLRGGVFHGGRSVTLTHWDNRKEKSWIHRGNPDRIRRQVNGAFQMVLATAHGVVTAYNGAKLVAIEDPYQFLEKQLSGQLTGKAIKSIQESLTGATLESCVDAVNMSGAGKDIYEQADIEKASSVILKKGLDIANNNGGSI
tara:strand:+ start:795 stop:1850 length:1056 start_codon:yes stop_codon:yes gene_type:complete